MLKRGLLYSLLLLLLAVFVYDYLQYKEIVKHNSESTKLLSSQIMIGFHGKSIQDTEFENTKKLIEDGIVHGLVFFDRNISNKEQLYDFIQDIRTLKNGQELLLAIDEEGGLVSRLGQAKGLVGIPTAEEISKYPLQKARQFFLQRAIFLRWLGFDINFAPVVDLDINQENKVIFGNKRSYSSSANIVVQYAEQFIRAHRSNGVLTVIKHYPGHGSSFIDSHTEFTDITETYQQDESIPYQKLIDKHLVDGIMIGHLFDENIDNKYPASLSEKHVSINLRGRLGFQGLVFTDDLQMGAINKYYKITEATKLAINSGIDVLLFADFFHLTKGEQEVILKLIGSD